MMNQAVVWVVVLCLPALLNAEDVTEDVRNSERIPAGERVELINKNKADNNITVVLDENLKFIVSNSSIMLNTTHRGFIHGFGESISMILVSEIGDKTFFIAAILAMRNNKLVVFLAAVSSLFLMTVLSGLLGWVFTTFIPREVTYYTCTAIMFLFALKMLWEAWRMDDNEAEETQREVEEELARRGSISSVNREDVERAATVVRANQSVQPEEAVSGAVVSEGDVTVGGAEDNQAYVPETSDDQQNESDKATPPITSEAGEITNSGEASVNTDATIESGQPEENADKQARNVRFLDNMIDRSCKESSWFGKKCLKIFKLFVNTFTMTFIAEWGDRSQLATIVLVGLNDVGGVILGGCVGHSVCTAGAVLAGALIAKFVSVRKVTFFGALVFLGFAIASIFISPHEDGIEGIPEIDGYDAATRFLNHNVSLTLQLQQLQDEEPEELYDAVTSSEY